MHACSISRSRKHTFFFDNLSKPFADNCTSEYILENVSNTPPPPPPHPPLKNRSSFLHLPTLSKMLGQKVYLTLQRFNCQDRRQNCSERRLWPWCDFLVIAAICIDVSRFVSEFRGHIVVQPSLHNSFAFLFFFLLLTYSKFLTCSVAKIIHKNINCDIKNLPRYRDNHFVNVFFFVRH